MNIIKKIFNRLKAECIWAKMGFYTRFVYYHRKPLLVYKLTNMGGGQVSEFCDLAVVSFNNSKVVEYQIRSLNRFFKFPFRYTVFDNSTKEVVSEEILAICKKHEVGYVKLPRQEFLPKGWGCYSHGIACNYLFRKFVKFGGAKYFMLLDHDLFLVDDFDISKKLKAQFFLWNKAWQEALARSLGNADGKIAEKRS